MVRNAFILAGFLALLPIPALAANDGLLPAICRQVVEPRADTTIAEVVKDYVVQKIEDIPQAVASSVVQHVDAAANSLAQNIESHKSGGSARRASGATAGAASPASSGLVSTLSDKILDGSAFLLRHWPWTLTSGAVVGVILFLV